MHAHHEPTGESSINECRLSIGAAEETQPGIERQRRQLANNSTSEEDEPEDGEPKPGKSTTATNSRAISDPGRMIANETSLAVEGGPGAAAAAGASGAIGDKRPDGPSEACRTLLRPLQLPQRILMGPGPSNCSNRVLRSLQFQIVGHMHTEFFELLDEVKAGLQYLFQTRNRLTLAISASGHSGLEASLGNLLEPGERLLVIEAGIWGERASEMGERLGFQVDRLRRTLGEALCLQDLERKLATFGPQVVFVAHSESSTGLKQPVEKIAQLVHRYGALLIVDTVASLGGEPVFVDRWDIDACYTGSQKVLGAPPGLTPVTFGPRAEKKILSRKTKPAVYYWDLKILGTYWNCFDKNTPRPYHHTASATLIYGLREALSQVVEEGLEALWARHATVAAKFHEGLRKRNFEFFVKNPEHRLNTVTAIVLPQNIDQQRLIQYAKERYSVEISGGLGPTVGKVIRIGLMGENSTHRHADLVLRILDEGLEFARKPMSHI